MDEIVFESESAPYDPYLTVLGLLKTHYGLEHGEEIYQLLFRTAHLAADASGEGFSPGILFGEDGGEFVGFSENPNE